MSSSAFRGRRRKSSAQNAKLFPRRPFDADREEYLSILLDYTRAYGVDSWGFCLTKYFQDFNKYEDKDAGKHMLEGLAVWLANLRRVKEGMVLLKQIGESNVRSLLNQNFRSQMRRRSPFAILRYGGHVFRHSASS